MSPWPRQLRGVPHLLAIPVIASAVAVMAACSSASHAPSTTATHAPDAASTTAASTPDLTQINDAMLVDAASFPPGLESAGLAFFGPYQMNPSGRASTDPSQCRPLVDEPDWTQGADVAFTPPGGLRVGGDRSYYVEISLPRQRPDLAGLVGQCGTVKFQEPAGPQGRTYSFDELPSSGVSTPSAIVLQYQYHLFRERLINERGDKAVDDLAMDGVKVIGYARGVFVAASADQVRADPNRAQMSPDDVQAVIKLFNDQTAKLAAA
jgi:hypothetical protein